MRSTSARRAASSTFSVPTTLVVDELARVPVRVRNRDQRAEVEDDLAAGERAGDGLGIDEVAGEDVDLVGGSPGSSLSSQPRSLREL